MARVKLTCWATYFLAIYAGIATISKEAQACSVGGLLFGQDNKVELKRTPVSDPPRSFDGKSTSLYKNYSGIDPYLVWKILRKSQGSKGEYETTVDFEKRKLLSPPYSIAHGYNTSHPLPFVAEVEEYSFRTRLNYNADKQLLTYAVFPERDGTFKVSVQRKIEQDSYLGENAFGVTRRVRRAVGCEVLISFPPPGNPTGGLFLANESNTAPLEAAEITAFDNLHSYIGVTLPATPAEARKYKSRKLSVVFTLRLKPPYISEWETPTFKEATLDDPVTIAISNMTIRGTLQGMYLFDQSTGRILASKIFGNE